MAATISKLVELRRQAIPVKLGDNWLILGTRGSGKTTFAKSLARKLMGLYPDAHLYVLDIKRRDFIGWPNVLSQDEAPPPLKEGQRVQVWQPIVEQEEEIEKWLRQIENDAPALLYVDEMAALMYGARRSSQNFKRLQKLGRGLPVGIVSLTQELAEMPRQLVGQATHVVRFRLLNAYEQRLGDRLVRKGDPGEPRAKHGFFYACEETGAPGAYYADKSEFFGGDK